MSMKKLIHCMLFIGLLMPLFALTGCVEKNEPDQNVFELTEVRVTTSDGRVYTQQVDDKQTESRPPMSQPSTAGQSPNGKPKNPIVKLTTNLGPITIELYPDKAPKTVENFLTYVNNGFYDGTIFHRVMRGFMIQGGGLTPNLVKKPARSPIVNECGPDLRNRRGTIAMARLNDPDSATCQFFINLVDNPSLDFDGPYKPGYAVFGKVIEGMDVVDRIAEIPVRSVGPALTHLPQQTVIIEQARQIP